MYDEGTAIADFLNPPKTVIGADDEQTAETVTSLYAGLPGPMVATSPDIAELIKYVDNPWHAADALLYQSGLGHTRVLNSARRVNLALGCGVVILAGWWAFRAWGSRPAARA